MNVLLIISTQETEFTLSTVLQDGTRNTGSRSESSALVPTTLFSCATCLSALNEKILSTSTQTTPFIMPVLSLPTDIPKV